MQEIFLKEPPSRFSGAKIVGSSYALGVGGSTAKSKMVLLEHVKPKVDSKWYYNNIVDILTLGLAEWREIQGVPNFAYNEISIFDKGFLYWLKSNKHKQIIVFDVENEVFSTIETPNQVDDIVDLGGYVSKFGLAPVIVLKENSLIGDNMVPFLLFTMENALGLLHFSSSRCGGILLSS